MVYFPTVRREDPVIFFLLQGVDNCSLGHTRRIGGMQLHEYEMMYIIRPELDEAAIAAAIAKVSGLVTANGGELVKAEPWGRRRLAYPIQQCRDGQYVLMQYKLDPKSVLEVERTLRISEDVIRYLVIRLDE